MCVLPVPGGPWISTNYSFGCGIGFLSDVDGPPDASRSLMVDLVDDEEWRGFEKEDVANDEACVAAAEDDPPPPLPPPRWHAAISIASSCL